MTPVLSRQGQEVIARLAADRALLAFDYDGTLAPIVADRERAEMRPATRELLRALASTFPCAVISGRERADLAARVAGLPLVAVVGNHGAEPEGARPLPGARARVEGWTAMLRAGLSHLPAVEVEAKGLSVAVHHRAASPSPAELARIRTLAGALPGARVFEGEAAVNVALAESPTKAGALEALARAQNTGTVLYVGDDVDDEDAFRSKAVTFGVRVGRSERSAARWFVESQPEVDDLLRAVAAARAPHARGEEGWRQLTALLEPGGGS